MRAFITGASGFLGGHVIKALHDRGYETIGMSRSGESSKRIASLGAEVLSGDLTDAASVAACIKEAKPTHVIHLGAETALQRNKKRIDQVNIAGTEAVVKACWKRRVEKLIFLSTVVRGQANGRTLREDDEIPTTTHYGRSKAAAEKIALSGMSNPVLPLPAVVLRPSHIYGPGGWFADIVENHKSFRIPGDGANLWDMVHVDDVASAIILAMIDAEPGETYHVVDDTPVTMQQVFDKVAEGIGRKPFGHVPTWVAKIAKGAGPIDAAVRSAKSSNAKLKLLGWMPKHKDSLASIPGVVRKILGRLEPAGVDEVKTSSQPVEVAEPADGAEQPQDGA